MTQKCAITGKMPLAGNSVSHAHNKNRRRFNPNLHNHRLWHPGLKQYIRLRLSAKGIRIIDKYGVEAVLDAIKNNRKIRKPEAIKQENKTQENKIQENKAQENKIQENKAQEDKMQEDKA